MNKYFNVEQLPLFILSIDEELYNKDKDFFNEHNPHLRTINSKWYYDFYVSLTEYYKIKHHIEELLGIEK